MSPDRQCEEAAVMVSIGKRPGDTSLSLHHLQIQSLHSSSLSFHLLNAVAVVEGVMVKPDRGEGAADLGAGAGGRQGCRARVLCQTIPATLQRNAQTDLAFPKTSNKLCAFLGENVPRKRSLPSRRQEIIT